MPAEKGSAKTMSSQQQQQQVAPLLGVKGIRLKRFEQVLTKLLPHIEPRFIALPPPPTTTAKRRRSGACDNNSSSRNTQEWSKKKEDTKQQEWPDWNKLPPAARVHGSLPGQLSNLERATRKEDQLRSMMQCIFALLLPPDDDGNDNVDHRHHQNSYTIVDFGGGSGHLSIPLALMLPHCTIVVVDLKQKSLDFLHEKADKCCTSLNELDSLVPQNDYKLDNQGTQSSSKQPQQQQQRHLNSTAIRNLWTFAGDVESYADSFDLGVALHVCGEATDVVLRKCAKQKAHLVVAPCCVGKLNRQKKDPYIYRATTQNTPTIQYPQSQLFRQCLQCSNSSSNSSQNINGETTDISSDDWDALAKAADYSHELDMHNRRNAARRAAKGVLEMDRQLFLQEEFPYQAALTRMSPLTASPKHDILLAYYCDSTTIPTFITDIMSSEPHTDQVVTWTKDHLLCPGSSSETSAVGESGGKRPDGLNSKKRNTLETFKTDSVDWTWEEEQSIRTRLLTQFPLSVDSSSAAESTKEVDKTKNSQCDDHQKDPAAYVFPSGMGGRKRKLIHFVAEQLGLAHWSVGKKNAEKTVACGLRPSSIS